MFRDPDTLNYSTMTVVAGCGGGESIATHLEHLVHQSARLVLDADALNAIAQSPALQSLLQQRKEHSTVITPHPLEAARLLKIQCAEVQNNRLQAAQALANRFGCTVVLKGSGTVIASPLQLPHINPTGNARLASAGTGDVLAGWIGARMAAGHQAFRASCDAVYLHGSIADAWPPGPTLTAQRLLQAIASN
jgi:hydroxyethylthiazole kinase-like uncharacterized protein yjeF